MEPRYNLESPQNGVLVRAGRSQVYYSLDLSSKSGGPMREAIWLAITTTVKMDS